MRRFVKRWIRNGRVKINHRWYVPRDPWHGSSLQNGAWAWFGRYIGDERVVSLHSFPDYPQDDQPNIINGEIWWLFWELESEE